MKYSCPPPLCILVVADVRLDGRSAREQNGNGDRGSVGGVVRLCEMSVGDKRRKKKGAIARPLRPVVANLLILAIMHL